ncbi:MAG TPA: hypothetical protein VJN66_08645 [Rhodanobacteraceae bacterium]|nr:hypothetical protein [Rhodanobacteraceae bacterium]
MTYTFTSAAIAIAVMLAPIHNYTPAPKAQQVGSNCTTQCRPLSNYKGSAVTCKTYCY